MATRLGKFELPNRLIKEEETANEKYAKFIADPFESGYGHTIGNAFRRVLLSSIEGAAISSLKIDGVQHEFQSVDGVVEDVTDVEDIEEYVARIRTITSSASPTLAAAGYRRHHVSTASASAPTPSPLARAATTSATQPARSISPGSATKSPCST